jgi:thiamine-phosphate pyrophosphorylase
MEFELPAIYPITDKQLSRRTSHFSILRELVRGGARLVQIRDKHTAVPELLRDLVRCVEFAEKNGVRIIVNDRCDLVLSSGAMGVHLGQEDLPPEAARAILGRDKWIGLSTHSASQVRQSNRSPVQYIGFGPVYASATKRSESPPLGLRRLARACSASAFPVVAIGGIGLDQVREVLKAGASSAAVISALMKAENLALQMQRFLEKSMER